MEVPSDRWARASRISVQVWFWYFIVLIAIGVFNVGLYTAALHLGRPLALALLVPVIGFLKTANSKERWVFFKNFGEILLLSILVNWTLLIGGTLAEILVHL
jgi:hypothetical protein